MVLMDELFGNPVPPQEPKFQHTNYGRVTPSDRSNRIMAPSGAPQTSPRPTVRQSSRPVSPAAVSTARAGRLSPLMQSQVMAGGPVDPRHVRGLSNDRLGSPGSGNAADLSITSQRPGQLIHDSIDIAATRLHNNLGLHDVMDKPRTGFPHDVTDKARTGFPSLTGGRLSPLEMKTPRMQVPTQPGPSLHNTSSHNSSKLSSTHSGTGLNQTKSFRENMNSTLISPVSTSRKERVERLNSSATSQLNATLNNTTRLDRLRKANMSNVVLMSADRGTKETLQSLALLAILSLLLSLLSLVFLLKLTPVSGLQSLNLLTAPEQKVVRQVTQVVCCLTICLDLSCLLISTLQFVSSVKLLKSSQGRVRSREYLNKSSKSRSCSIAAFISSIPLFLIGIVLFIFLNYSMTPAIVSSIIIGCGILFCGAAVVHNVFVCQQEKSVVRSSGDRSILQTNSKDKAHDTQYLSHITLPHATLDLSSSGLNGTITARNLELSTLV